MSKLPIPPYNTATHFVVEDGRTQPILVRRSDGVAECVQLGADWLPCRSTPVLAAPGPGPIQAEAEPVKIRLEIQVEPPAS